MATHNKVKVESTKMKLLKNKLKLEKLQQSIPGKNIS